MTRKEALEMLVEQLKGETPDESFEDVPLSKINVGWYTRREGRRECKLITALSAIADDGIPADDLEVWLE